MGRPKRNFLAMAEDTASPPASLPTGHVVARVQKAEGKNLYSVMLSVPGEGEGEEPLLVELPSRFRSQIWIKRGSYVIVDTLAFDDRDNKLGGEIANVVREEKLWRKQGYWPPEFMKKPICPDGSDQESTCGKVPPVEDSDTNG